MLLMAGRPREAKQLLESAVRALMFNPRHRSAHGHLGELYLVLREPAKAEEHLAALERICLIPCEEFGDLGRAHETDCRVCGEKMHSRNRSKTPHYELVKMSDGTNV